MLKNNNLLLATLLLFTILLLSTVYGVGTTSAEILIAVDTPSKSSNTKASKPVNKPVVTKTTTNKASVAKPLAQKPPQAKKPTPKVVASSKAPVVAPSSAPKVAPNKQPPISNTNTTNTALKANNTQPTGNSAIENPLLSVADEIGQSSNSVQKKRPLKTQYFYRNNIRAYFGTSSLEAMKSHSQDYFFNEKVNLKKTSSLLFGISYAKESFKNLFTQASFKSTSFNYKLSDTNLPQANLYKVSDNYLTLSNYNLAINIYYNVQTYKLLESQIKSWNTTLKNIIKDTNFYAGLGLGVNIINAKFNNIKDKNIQNSTYFNGTMDVFLGVDYAITPKHFIGINYLHSIAHNKILNNEFGPYNTRNIKFNYGFRF